MRRVIYEVSNSWQTIVAVEADDDATDEAMAEAAWSFARDGFGDSEKDFIRGMAAEPTSDYGEADLNAVITVTADGWEFSESGEVESKGGTMDVDYPYVRAWGQMMGSFATYIADQVARAKADGAPQDATFKSQDGDWHTVADVTDDGARSRLEAFKVRITGELQ